MRILYLAHRVPYPPNKGDKIRTFHHLRHLAAAHDVHLLAFADRAEDLQWADPLAAVCRSVELIPLGRVAALARGTTGLLRGGSLSEGYFGAAAMWRAVQRADAVQPADVTWACSAAMAQYALASRAARRVVDLVDVDSEKWREHARHTRGPRAWLYHLEATRLALCEQRVGRSVDHVLLVSNREAACLRRAVSAAPIRVVPNGVDMEFFRPPPERTDEGPPRLVFVGALDYGSNVDAVVSFLGTVWPVLRQRMPEIAFSVVGHRPSARVRRAIRRAGGSVQLAASVPDVRPYLRAATACVAPLRFGRGVKNKVLEAMAMGVPVVASRVAAEGLAVRDGTHLLLADEPGAFAAAVLALLDDPERRRALASNALSYVRQAHAWERVLHLLDGCVDDGVLPRAGQV